MNENIVEQRCSSVSLLLCRFLSCLFSVFRQLTVTLRVDAVAMSKIVPFHGNIRSNASHVAMFFFETFLFCSSVAFHTNTREY